jgi:hypothetical protein
MGMKRRPPRKRLLCRGCEQGVTEPGLGARCSHCKIRVCDHLKPNLINRHGECVWCASLLVIESELRA